MVLYSRQDNPLIGECDWTKSNSFPVFHLAKRIKYFIHCSQRAEKSKLNRLMRIAISSLQALSAFKYETPPAENNAMGSRKIDGFETFAALQINSKSPAILYWFVNPPKRKYRLRSMINDGKGTNVFREIIDLESVSSGADTQANVFRSVCSIIGPNPHKEWSLRS